MESFLLNIKKLNSIWMETCVATYNLLNILFPDALTGHREGS